MKLSMFLQDNLQIGKGSIKIPTKGMIDSYRERYDKMIDNGLLCTHKAFIVSPGNRTMVHIKVPSETVSNFYYDVVLELETVSKTNITDCDIRIFSNSPSFVYSFAYVFYHLDLSDKLPGGKKRKGMLIDKMDKKVPKDRLLMPSLEDKIGDDVLHNAPIVRNSLGLPLFDKSIYYAIFHLIDKVYPAVIADPIRVTERRFLSDVRDFDKLMQTRKRIVDKERETKKKEKKDHKAEVDKKSPKGSGVNMIKPITKKAVQNKSVRVVKPMGKR